MKKWLKTSLAVCLTTALLAGCSFGQGSAKKEEEPSTLKVLYYHEDSFYSEFGMLYSAINKNVDIEVVSTQDLYNQVNEEEGLDYNTAYLQLIEKEQPDVIMVEPGQLTSLGEEGKLYDIENFVNEESYNAAGLINGLVDSMKTLGNGKLYGIPTNVWSQAIFYNKDLFDEYNVPYPTDKMTWDQIIALAEMFPSDGEFPDRIYGLKMGYSKDLNEIVNTLAMAENIKMYNLDTMEMTIDTPAWQGIIEKAMKIRESNALFYDNIMYENESYMNQRGDYYSSDLFYSNRLAMRLDSNWLINELDNLDQYAQNPADLIKNWDIVTAPVSSASPDESSYVNYGGIFAINSASTNIDQAWDFISYVTGDEFARVKSKLQYSNLPLRTAYLKQEGERNYEAFYALRPSSNNSNDDYLKLPQLYQYEFYGHMQQELQKITDGQTTIAEALSALQIKGNELLAAGKMTEEEMEQYWKDKEGGVEIMPMPVDGVEIPEASGEAIEEVVVE